MDRRRRPAPLRRRSRALARRRATLAAVALVALGTALLIRTFARSGPPSVVLAGPSGPVSVPVQPSLSPLRTRIVALAESQLGYRTDPANTYCNKFSAYWYSGQRDCPNGNWSEQWCADFAAWVWHRAGAAVVYRYERGDLNASSASFYEWGLRHGTWHPVRSGYVPQPGDVAVYGLEPARLVATHVAVVIGRLPGQPGPVAVNGDGDLTGFSVVELRANELDADVHPTGAPLSGYVAPST